MTKGFLQQDEILAARGRAACIQDAEGEKSNAHHLPAPKTLEGLCPYWWKQPSATFELITSGPNLSNSEHPDLSPWYDTKLFGKFPNHLVWYQFFWYERFLVRANPNPKIRSLRKTENITNTSIYGRLPGRLVFFVYKQSKKGFIPTISYKQGGINRSRCIDVTNLDNRKHTKH